MDGTVQDERDRERYLTGLIQEAARRRLGDAEAARDCVVIFLEKVLEMPAAQRWPYSNDTAAVLTAAAERCARTEAERLRRLRAHELCFVELWIDRLQNAAIQPVCRDPGPEQRAILANTVCLIRMAMRRLSRSYRALFVSVFIDHKTHVQLAKEMGRSRQSVDRSVQRLIATIRRILAGMGLTDGEIADLINQVDRCRNVLLRYRRPRA